MNQEKLQSYILPGEKVIKRPTGFPSLPLKSEHELFTQRALETFLSNDANLSAATGKFFYCVFVKSNDYVLKKLCIYFLFPLQSMYLGRFVDKSSLDNSVKKILRNVICNDVANKYSFQGAKGKQKFEVLKTWELILGEIKNLKYFQVFLLI